ncbi:MAG: tetratricopeptide repeat protein [Paludibacteraceae bacterium]|nr:tetratricopeptide repeat protein [Paludibacteraceae bacterium]
MKTHHWFTGIMLVWLSGFSGSLAAQTAPIAFVKGLELINSNAAEAKTQLLIAQHEDPTFHGTYHFLGVLYLDENKLDSAVSCFKQAIALNPTNANKTKEMAYMRLVDVYLYQHNFDLAFTTAWEAFELFPDNLAIKQNLHDVCLWAFYVNHNGLNINYISKDLVDEYVVRSISEEYLIIRRKMVDGTHLYVESQSVLKKDNAFYDVFTCTHTNNNKYYVIFKLDWDFNTNFGGQVPNTDDVYANSANSVAERLGALLVDNARVDLKKEMAKLEKK